MAKAKAEVIEKVEEVAEAKPVKGVAKLEEEGDIAADYLEALLDIADLDGDIDIDVKTTVPPWPSSEENSTTWWAEMAKF